MVLGWAFLGINIPLKLEPLHSRVFELHRYAKDSATLNIAMSSLPIVLLHGHTLDARMWQPQMVALSGCIAPTLRGYGTNLPLEQEFSFCEDLIGSLGVKRFHLVGLSLGGNIALEMAIKYPEFVASLCLLDSSLKGLTPDAAQLEVGEQVARAYQTGGLEAARTAWLGAPLFAPARANPRLEQQLRQWVNEYSGWHWARGISPSVAIADVSSRLSEIRTKTLIVVGQHDTAYFHAVARFLHTGIADSRFEVVAGAGHLVNLEQPEVVNQLLKAHWATTEPEHNKKRYTPAYDD
jgi:3-oxoadipate enol-lactonase